MASEYCLCKLARRPGVPCGHERPIKILSPETKRQRLERQRRGPAVNGTENT